MQCHLLFKINLCVVLIFYAKFITSVIGSEDGTEIEGLPYCGPEHISTENFMKKVVLVSTLDGHLSAIDTSNEGSLLWTVKTGPEPLLSSSIHSLELTNNGQWIRMIPSLSGSLYRFNKQSIEAVPITTDSLLHSSAFLFSEGAVFSGGKETFTFGLDPKTGAILYDCSMKRCDNGTEGETDVIVVRKVIQTIRAIDPRSGSEKWNFSVGLHEVKLFLDENAECHGSSNTPVAPLHSDVRVIVPQGLVCGVRDSHILWSHKFDAPIVSAWQVKDDGKMVNVDLFGSSPWQFEDSNVSPMLYIGMHKKQLYIQESVMLQHILGDKPSRIARIPWKPVPATGTALGLPEAASDAIEGNSSNEFAATDDGSTALSVLYASEYVNGNGYYLYGNKEELFGGGQIVSANKPQCTSEGENNVTISGETEDHSSEEENEETPVQVMIVSLWFWWKEVVLISVTTAIFVNILIQKFNAHLSPRNQIQYHQKEVVVLEDSSPGKPEKDSGVDLHLPSRSHSDPGPVASTEFVSRYLTDFDPVYCLGRGGFGVVFEAKNKIDDCHYAVKRIPLPNRAESRERVLREVKALAKLDHHNIVRYFNAWLECPPPGWQEEQDKAWPISAPSCYSDATSIDITSHLKDIKCSAEPSVSESVEFLNFRRRTSNGFTQSTFRKCAQDEGTYDDSSSYIKFELSKDSVKYDDTNSFIKFELSNNKHDDDSIISINSVSDDTGSTCSYKDSPVSLKRPSSLNVTSGGNVLMPPKPCGRMYLYIQMQLCQKESLREWLHREIVSREREKVLEMFLQIVDAVEYVHLQELIHRDLKPSNIFFSLDGQIKIGDFGLVTAMIESDQMSPVTETCGRFENEKHTARVGTQLYMSPEQSAGLPYNYKVDIYSLGVILFELLVPFKTDMERLNVLTNVRQNNMPADFQKDFSEEFELLRLMLSHHPKERPTTFGIRAHPPFCKFRESLASINNSSWHFDLPSRRRASYRTLSGSSSGESNDSQAI